MKRFISAIPLPISLFLICVACFGILVLLESVSDRREEKTNLFNQLYRIEPESLLAEIEHGNAAVFFPIDEGPPWPSPDQQIPVPWSQGDYLRITNALFEFIWSDTLTDWQLNLMLFGLGCTKSDVGLQYGIFTFFRNEEAHGNKSRIERIVNIDSRDKTVYIAENKYEPNLVDWSAIDLNENLVSAEEALQITESVGGKEKRYLLRMLVTCLYLSIKILVCGVINGGGRRTTLERMMKGIRPRSFLSTLIHTQENYAHEKAPNTACTRPRQSASGPVDNNL